MTCSLVYTHAVLHVSSYCRLQLFYAYNAPHRYSDAILQATTAAVAAFLHSSLWFPGDFPTELIKKKKSRPPAWKVLPQKQWIYLPWPYRWVITPCLNDGAPSSQAELAYLCGCVVWWGNMNCTRLNKSWALKHPSALFPPVHYYLGVLHQKRKTSLKRCWDGWRAGTYTNK